MRIRSVTIDGFRAIDHLELDFRDAGGDPRTIVTLAGPNGCGKTSILYAITNALRGVFGYRTDDVPLPTRDDLRRPKKMEWSDERGEARVEVGLDFTAAEQESVRQTLSILGRDAPPDLDNDGLTVTWQYPPPFDREGQRQPVHFANVAPAAPGIRSWLMAKTWAIQGWRNGVRGIFEHMRNLGGLFFFPQDRDLRRRVGALAPAREGESETSGAAKESATRWRPTVHDVLDEFSRRFARTSADDPNNWESHVKRLYHAVCRPKQYLGFRYREDTPEGAPVFVDGDRQYPLSHAASGEHVVLEYIIELCRFGPPNRSIILVDEPEVHLHPLWVRRLYLSLSEFGQENQFFLTTHSPELRQRACSDGSLVELGSLENGG